MFIPAHSPTEIFYEQCGIKMENIMPKDRQKWIDNAKGIAILLVIIGHVSGGLSGVSFQFVYGIHLTMFFLLSGYTLKTKVLTQEYVNIKFRRLMVPYFYTCFAILITDVINCLVLYHDASIQTVTKTIGNDLVRSFFASGAVTSFGTVELGTRIGAIWFFPALFFATIIFQFLLQKTLNDSILGFSTAAIALIGIISGRYLWVPFSLQSGMMASFFLWIGYEIKKRNVLSKIKWYHYVIAQIILLFGIHFGYCNIAFVAAQINDVLISIPVGLAGCLLIYLLSMINKNGFILSYIGRISLKVLCVHLYALETIGPYFERVLNRFELTGNARIWMLIIISVLFAVLTAVGIEAVRSYVQKRKSSRAVRCTRIGEKRDLTIDIAKGIFIIVMIIGHFPIDHRLRNIIFSCHMVAFVFFSGLFYRSTRNPVKTIKRMVKTFLLPYCAFVLAAFLLGIPYWSSKYFQEKLIQYSLGISYARKLFLDIPSVGPVYFILLLFVVRCLYMIIDRAFRSEPAKWLVVLGVSLSGVFLGEKEFWLPWSFDAACYCVVFYKLGILFREKGLLQAIKDNHFSYFVLSPIWVYMIHAGGMEIAIRQYGEYGLVIIGSIAGTLLFVKLSSYMANHLPVCRNIFALAGESSIIILIIHTLLGARIGNFVSARLDPNYFPYMFICTALQLALSFFLKKCLNYVFQLQDKTRSF